MNVIIPPKRRDGNTSFMKLVSYISVRDEKPSDSDVVTDKPNTSASQSDQAVFDRLVDYIDRGGVDSGGVRVTDEFEDGRQRVLVGEVACETNCFSWETAAAEMNMVAAQNRRCNDAVYHFILSWREHEVPTNAQIFESAQHCINALGMDGHQYVTAIHQDTDNIHCHVAVNRVNPQTYKAANMWSDAETLQKCCRVLERRYGFEQDNGSWEWSARDTLVPATPRFQGAPQGAAKTQIYSDKESLFHYSVRTVRDEIDQVLDRLAFGSIVSAPSHASESNVSRSPAVFNPQPVDAVESVVTTAATSEPIASTTFHKSDIPLARGQEESALAIALVHNVQPVHDGWKQLHLLLHKNGLGLREQGGGLVVYDFLRPDTTAVKASSVHPSLTKARLETHYGAFKAAPAFESDDARYGIFDSYQPSFQLRDKGARDERREERAAAREALKGRYQAYRRSWEKPDLNVPAREQQIALRYRSMKENVRRSQNDPLLRKLMYRVAEFERMKAMAELRLELRQERRELSEKGAYRPLPYRVWVEQEALNGDEAAVSQLRGFAYREKRKERMADTHNDRIIVCGPADDSALFDRGSHASQIRRDGTIEYLRYGRVGVVDRGDQVEIRSGFEVYDDLANYKMAAGIVSTKSGERVEVVGDPQFVDQVLEAGCRFNHQYRVSHFPVTDPEQQARYEYLETYHVRPSLGYQDESEVDPQVNRYESEQEEDVPPVWSPRL